MHSLSVFLAICGAALAGSFLSAGAGIIPFEGLGAAQDSIEARLRRLEDREAIRNLLMEYGRSLDQRDFEAFSRLFAENGGEWVGGFGCAKGPELIRKLMEERIGKNTGGRNSPNFHLFSNETITVSGDKASALTKWIFVVRGGDNRPELVYLGHYDDTFIRERGQWKFLRRLVYSDIPAADPPVCG